uniref:Uncharacterized protein n=1 Tax=Arundo donax TaxID=35708 RepID=A0A0A9EDF5_ARUDO
MQVASVTYMNAYFPSLL